MAFELPNHHRKPANKTQKIKNKALIDKYRRDFPYCEWCKLDGKYVTTIETHHIKPGIDRSDEISNIINLCHGCHIKATEHVNGEKARLFNFMLQMIKIFKNEMQPPCTIEGIDGLKYDFFTIKKEIKAKYDKAHQLAPMESAWDVMPNIESFDIEVEYVCHPQSEWIKWARKYESELKKINRK